MAEADEDDVPVHLYVDELMEERELTDREVARRLGWKESTFRLLREGKLKVPFDMIPDLADAIGADRANFMTRALREYMPKLIEAASRCFGQLTDREVELLDFIEEITDGRLPPLDDDLRAKLREAFGRT